MKNDLAFYKKVFTSQWGEDGIIQEIFNRISVRNKVCVEFGAGRGRELSNTWHLIADLGWRALLMDGNPDHCKLWSELIGEKYNVRVLELYVESSGENSLDKILEKNNIPRDFDLLSIDIDGNDYYIFESLKTFKPRVLIIEHNPTIPPDEDIVQQENEDPPFGSSAKALVSLAEKKGYCLAAATHTNCIFVCQKDFPLLKIDQPPLEEIFDKSGLSYIITALNGTAYLKNAQKRPSFSWLYPIYNAYLSKKSFHVFSAAIGRNSLPSETLTKRFIPVRLFIEKSSNTGHVVLIFFKFVKDNLFKLINKND